MGKERPERLPKAHRGQRRVVEAFKAPPSSIEKKRERWRQIKREREEGRGIGGEMDEEVGNGRQGGARPPEGRIFLPTSVGLKQQQPSLFLSSFIFLGGGSMVKVAILWPASFSSVATTGLLAPTLLFLSPSLSLSNSLPPLVLSCQFGPCMEKYGSIPNYTAEQAAQDPVLA